MEDNRVDISKQILIKNIPQSRNSIISSRRRSQDVSKLLQGQNSKKFEEILKEYSPYSFFCLSKQNKFRVFFIKMIEQTWFEIVTQVTVISCMICMLFYTYSQRICDREIGIKLEICLEKYKSDIERDDILENIFFVFNALFGLEMVCKMIAKGLILDKKSYLRNGWNILDCFITIWSFMELAFPGIDKLFALRVIRLLRVLKSFHKLPGIRRLVVAIIISLPTLGNVLLFLGFVFLVFGTLGIQLFSGVFYNRCRLAPVEIRENGTFVKWYSKPVLDNLCAPDNISGTFTTCPQDTRCVNFYDIPTAFNYVVGNITIDMLNVSDEGLSTNYLLNYGVSNFDNIFNCLINVFCFMTIQNWAEILTLILDGKSTFLARLYFNIVVIIGGFFIIKLILAAQNDALLKVRMEEVEQKIKMIGICEKQTNIYLSKEQVKDIVDKDAKEAALAIKNKFGKTSNFKAKQGVMGVLSNAQASIKPVVLFEMDVMKTEKTNQEIYTKKAAELYKLRKSNDKNVQSNDIMNESVTRAIDESTKALNPASSSYAKFRWRNERVTKYQKDNILIIEGQTFDHSCTDIKRLLTAFVNKDRQIDPYLVKLYKVSAIAEPDDGNNFLKDFKIILVAKIKYLILEQYASTYQYIIFNSFIYLITLLNILFLCFLAYPMDDSIIQEIDIINIICSTVFVIEITFKLLVLGFKGFFREKLNVADFIVVLLGIFEIIYVKANSDPTDDANSSLSSLRAIRFIRLLKLFRKGSFIAKFVMFIIVCLGDLLNYCLLLAFFVFMFSVAGRELFANSIQLIMKEDEYHYYYEESCPPRQNFDSFLNSLVTVFILFIGDNWPNIMYEYEKTYLTLSQIYFVGLIIVGNIMLFNLFLSILISNYDEDNLIDLFVQGKDDQNLLKKKFDNLKMKLSQVKMKVTQYIEKCLNCCKKDDTSAVIGPGRGKMQRRIGMTNITAAAGTTAGDNEMRQSDFQMRLEKGHIPLERTSLFIFSTKSTLRKFCHSLVTNSQIFDYIVLVNILISLIILAIDTPTLDNITTKKTLFAFDIFTTVFFVIETGIKIISMGFLFNGEYSYLRYEYNFIEFCSIILSMLYIIATAETISDANPLEAQSEVSAKVFRVIKVLRIIRVMKLVGISKSLQAALAAFYASLKQMLKIIIIGSLFILMFSLIGVTYFRGLFFRCEFTKVPRHLMNKVVTKWDCMDYGGDWINPYPNFDNIKSSFVLFFEMMTTEGWTNYMFAAVDASEINYQPIRDYRFRWSLFFVLYMVFAYFFLLNLAIAILSDNFKKEKLKIENSVFQFPIQNEFFKALKKLYQVPLPKNRRTDDKITKILLNILDSIYFDVVITACIISNLVILMMNWPDMDKRTSGFIDYMNMILNYVFICEAAVKIFVYRCEYFTNGWNILDFIIVTETVISLLMKLIIGDMFDRLFDASILRALRVGRILRLLKKAQSLNKVFNLFINSIPGVINILILYFLLIYIYSILGMSLFSSIKYQKIISSKWNFQDFPSSLSILVRITSGEGWNTIMRECTFERKGNFFCKYNDEMNRDELMYGHIGCGTIWAIPYFLSFVILSTMMFLEFFSVVISSAMNDTYVICLEELRKGQINKFKHKWAAYDKDCSGFMLMSNFQKFLYDIGYPLGISSLKVADFIRICSLLNIYTYGEKNYVFFYDVLTELTKYYLIHKNVEDQCSEITMFSNPEDVIDEKTELFICNIMQIGQVQEEKIFKALNPYTKYEKFYKKYDIDEFTTDVKFTNSHNLLVHFSWAFKKLSAFVRCYLCMKIKCLKLIETNTVRVDLLKYGQKYAKRDSLIKSKERLSNEIIREQSGEMSKCEYSENEKDGQGNNSKNISQNPRKNLSELRKDNSFHTQVEKNINHFPKSSNHKPSISTKPNSRKNTSAIPYQTDQSIMEIYNNFTRSPSATRPRNPILSTLKKRSEGKK